MTSREYKYHHRPYTVVKYSASGFSATIHNPNFAILMPTDIARNPDGTPKQVHRDYLFVDRDYYVSPSPVAGPPVTITITNKNKSNYLDLDEQNN